MAFPTKRTDAVVAEILRRMSSGEPLARICRDEEMPHPSTWADWCKQDEALGFAHARARDDGFDAIAADILDIADTPMTGETITIKPDGTVETKRGDMFDHRKLRIETRLKLLAKWDPKRYGEMLKHANADGSNIDLTDRMSAARERAARGE